MIDNKLDKTITLESNFKVGGKIGTKNSSKSSAGNLGTRTKTAELLLRLIETI
jgi:hypothetical protein